MAAMSIFVGAGLGALARWGLGNAYNQLNPNLPMGTLAANLIGGLLMGVVLGLFAQFETLPPAWRLAVTTGFLGGLTTFSTFSADATALLLRGQWGWGALLVLTHVGGSLLATVTGIYATRALLPMTGGAA